MLWISRISRLVIAKRDIDIPIMYILIHKS